MAFCSRAARFRVLLYGAIAALAFAAPAQAAAFIDAAGRRVILPDHIGRILPAERNAEVLVFVLAPDKLAGFERPSGRALGSASGGALLRWRPRSTPSSMAATARQVGANLIIDAGPVTSDRAAFAEQVQQETGIPYILVDDSFTRIPDILRGIGALLGVGDRAEDLGSFAEHAIDFLRGKLLIRPANTRQRLYYALGVDGLTTPLPGSPAAASLDEAGVINVATTLGRGTQVRISRDALLAWDPDVIIAEQRGFYNSLRRDRTWRRLSAVRNGRVYLEPTTPFGWIEGPSGVNRLIGLYWLSGLLYPEATQDDLRSASWRSLACDFYHKFYRMKLTNAQLEAMLQPAGAPPLSDTTRAGTQSPVGLNNTVGTLTLPPGAAPIGSGGAPSADCNLPTGASPRPLPGITSMPTTPLGPQPAAPGVPPPGQRGNPAGGVPGGLNQLGPLPR